MRFPNLNEDKRETRSDEARKCEEATDTASLTPISYRDATNGGRSGAMDAILGAGVGATKWYTIMVDHFTIK